jgi:hypothetical protein
MNKIVLAVALSVACAIGAWAWFGGKTQPVQAPIRNSTSKTVGNLHLKSASRIFAVAPDDSGDALLKTDERVAEAIQRAEDARMSSIVPGIWETNRTGRRVLTVLTDGTATMDVTVEGAYAFIVGDKMTFNIKWKIADGNLEFEMIDGEPESSVNAVISLFGNKKVQQIIDFSPDKFVLKDNDGDDDHVWSRIKVMKSED